MNNKVTALILCWESGIIQNVLFPTCKVISPYCSNIIITHCGPPSQLHRYNFYKEINNVKIVSYDYKGNAEDVLRHMMTMVPENEWALILDSDQRPSELFLKNIDNSIDTLNSIDCKIASFPTLHHEYQDDILNIFGNDYPQTQVEVDQKHTYTIRSLCKINNDFSIKSNNGMHYSFRSANNRHHYFPYPVNHYKLYFEYFSSIFLCGYSNPKVHSFSDREKELDIINAGKYEEFDALKLKLNMPTSNEFKDRAYNKTIPQEFIDFFSNPSLSKENNPNTSHFLDHGYKFCMNYKFSFYRSFSNSRYCGNPCCKYGDIQL